MRMDKCENLTDSLLQSPQSNVTYIFCTEQQENFILTIPSSFILLSPVLHKVLIFCIKRCLATSWNSYILRRTLVHW